MVDILIPIGGRPESANDELRIALRSIAKYTDVDRVFIITTADIPWLKNVNIVKLGDPHKDNKDKNLIYKVINTLKQNPDIDDFIFWSDDQVITKPCNLSELPIVYNDRGLDYFSKIENKSKWQRRVENTLAVLNLLKFDVTCNWEAHVPEPFNSKKLLDGLGHIDWESSAGNYTICTLFAYACGYNKKNAIDQNKVKYTYEQEKPSAKFDKLFIGYNDTGFNTGLKEALFDHFKDPCKYESDGSSVTPVGILATNITDLKKFEKFISPKDIVFALDATSYDTIRGSNINICYVPSESKVTFNTVKTAINIAKLMVNKCIVIDGTYAYKDNYIEDSKNMLGDDIALCISNALKSFSTMVFRPKEVSDCLDNVLAMENITNLGAFLIDNGVRPVVIVNNAT